MSVVPDVQGGKTSRDPRARPLFRDQPAANVSQASRRRSKMPPYSIVRQRYGGAAELTIDTWPLWA
eukprot:scaffold128348_cov30-Prasinocladus_malaysianus.AAC.1